MKNKSEGFQESIAALQSKVKQISACLSFQNEELKNRRKQLLYDSKSLMDLRCISFMRVPSLMQTSIMNIETVLILPYMLPNSFVISERLIEMSGIGYIRSDITKFLHQFFKLGLKIPKLFSQIQNQDFLEISNQTNFIPYGVNPKELFGMSTFPSLFSYCWNSELQVAYLNSIAEIAKNAIESVDQFQTHWLFSCIKSYILASDIQRFVTLSIGNVFVKIPHPPNLMILPQQYYDILLVAINKSIKKMIDSLLFFPKDVRFLFKKFYEITQSNSQNQFFDFVNFLFIKCILEPALSNLIAFTSPKFKDRAVGQNQGLQLIPKIWSIIITQQIPFGDINFSMINTNNLIQFYTNLIDVNENNVLFDRTVTPSLSHFLNALDIQYNTTLFSISDVCLLAFFIQKLMPKDDKTIRPFATSLLSKVNEKDFRFFRHETWDFELYGMPKPSSSKKEESASTDFKLKACASSLFKFLSVTNPKISTVPSNTLKNFLKCKDIEADLSHDTKTRVYLSNLMVKIEKVGSNEDLFNALIYEIDEQKGVIDDNATLITDINLMSNKMNKLYRHFQNKLDRSMEMLYHRLLESFLKNRPNMIQKLQLNQVSLVQEKNAFDAFFNDTVKTLSAYLEFISPYAIEGVTIQLHFFLTRILNFSLFLNEHVRFEVNDEVFRNVQQSQIDNICSSMDRETLPQLLENVIQTFQLAMKVQIPLIALNYISKAIKQLNFISSFYPGKNNNFKRLLSYAILKVGYQHMFSFMKYLDFFLMNNKVILYSEKRKQNLIMYLKAIAELDHVLCAI